MSLKNYNQGFLFWMFCFWSLFFLTSKGIAQNKALTFNHLDVSNGLSNNSVFSIAQDSTGFIWLGTTYGLNRFDGRSFKVFKNDPKNQASISSNDYIKNLTTGKNGTIWVAVSGGLDLCHPKDNSFETIIPQSESIIKVLNDSKGNLWIGSATQLKFRAVNSTKIVSVKITKENLQATELFEDNLHHIWIGTSAGLFEVFFINKRLTIKRYFDSQFNSSSKDNHITTITQDKNLKYWIGTKKNGIYCFDKNSLQLGHFVKNSNEKNSLVNNSIRKIMLNQNGSLWIGTQDGLSILNPNSLQFTNYRHDPKKPNSLSQNSIFDLFQDKNGSVWIGTCFGGVNVVYSAKTPFTTYENTDNTNISDNIISAIAEDSKHNLWIGTEAEGGLKYFNRSTEQFTVYKNNINNPNSLSSNLIKALAIDKNQNLWIGTALGGLNLFDPKTASFKVFKANDNSGIASNDINCLLVNKENKLFIGIDIGLNIYDIAHKKFSLYKTEGKTYLQKGVSALFEDKKGTIWVGTPIGIYIYQGSKLKFINFKNDAGQPLNYKINCFFQDSKGNLWAGTYHNGLAQLNLKNNTFKILTKSNGLPNDNIVSIAEDKETNLWLGTDNGLVKYNRKLNIFRNFNIQDGLPNNQFNFNAVLNDKQERLFFGTYNGMVSFMPRYIEKNKLAPDVVLSNLKLFNIPVKINDKSGLLKQDLNFTETLTFDHDQNIFTIEFSALNFIKSNKNKYVYMLDGLEKNWNYVDFPSATYSNLPPGEYQFLVKAANNDGVWNTHVKKINIVVLPPIWKTWWAYIIYIITIAAITHYIFNFFKARADLKQELNFEKKKLDFFTNISHEIRTPLTLILGPIEKLEQLTAKNSQANKYAVSIKNNTERLYRLVNELLDFRKADSGNLRMYFSEEDLVSSLKEVFDHFQTLAEAKNMQYTFKSSNPQILVYFDKDQMEKVFFNLLSNAFKFTQNGGNITLEITQKEQQAEIAVTDNGKGIDIENIDDIFKNFYQAGQNIGTGIGLALSKSLIELHKGKINVTSTPATSNETGKTTFTVVLQLGKNHLSELDIAQTNTLPIVYEEAEDNSPQDFIEKPILDDKNKKAQILIVEDNDEVRSFIRQSLENEYHIHESQNGLEGWKNAIQTLPDLIISDVMMPIMDGLELCKKLKTDIRTSHIPVIMLTAKSDPLHQIEGLQHGADVYITKPFREQILELNIHNLLSLRAALQKKYSEQLLQLPVITKIEPSVSQDEIFLQKLYQIVENNISNSDLDINFITSKIGMSKSLLYMKFSALTNLSLSEFIKTKRFKNAIELFQKGETDILSVALQVGFNNTKYFSSEFKKMYGVTPNEYLKNKGKDKNQPS